MKSRIVFISGPPRSGTTMLQAMLDPAPLPECSFITKLIEHYDTIVKYSDPYRFGCYLKDKNTARLIFAEMINVIIDRLDRNPLVLKDPELVRFLPAVAQIFPGAAILTIVRDPRDAVASMKTVRRKQGQPGDVTEIICALAPYYAHLKTAPNIVRYEDIVQKQECCFEKIKKISGMKLHTGDWNFHGDKTDPFHTPYYGQAVTASRIGIWKKVLLEQECASVEAEFGEIFTTFGYELESYKGRRAMPFFISAANKARRAKPFIISAAKKMARRHLPPKVKQVIKRSLRLGDGS